MQKIYRLLTRTEYGIILPNYNGILISRTRLSVPIILTWRVIILRYMNLTEN